MNDLKLRIGIDFDNTIVCYDKIFCDLAKRWKLINPNFEGNKTQLRDAIRELPDGDTHWQRLQGKVYGEHMKHASLFPGFKEFIAACADCESIDVFIISHKTEFGHFDEEKINLRHAARAWLRDQGFIPLYIPEENVYFETTRDEKIARIISLQCTHFIDDLIEVLDSPLFPSNVKRFLFQANNFVMPAKTGIQNKYITHYTHWSDIKHEIFKT